MVGNRGIVIELHYIKRNLPLDNTGHAYYTLTMLMKAKAKQKTSKSAPVIRIRGKDPTYLRYLNDAIAVRKKLLKLTSVFGSYKDELQTEIATFETAKADYLNYCNLYKVAEKDR